jgi:uncharacterized protein YigE (DUF2233 family)
MAAIRSSLGLIALALAGCDGDAETETAAANAAEPDAAGHCRARDFEGLPFTVCRYDAGRHELELVVGPEGRPLRSFAALEEALGDRRSRLLFAMNGGMYDEDGRPIGLHVERGRTLRRLNRRDGPGNFHLKPNGAFAVMDDGRPRVIPAARWDRDGDGARWATQSGPMLVIDGRLHPRLSPNGESTNIRNGVGTECRAGTSTAWFAISETPVSFGRFARLFRDGLGCRNALFLDGTVSSLWDPGAERQDGYSELGPLIAVFRKDETPEPRRRRR